MSTATRNNRTGRRKRELADAHELMREMGLSEGADEILALIVFLQDNLRAQALIETLIREDRRDDWEAVCLDRDFERLVKMGVPQPTINELKELDAPRLHGGLTRRQVLLLLREFSARQSRVGLRTTLLLKLWKRLAASSPRARAPYALSRATLEMWLEAFLKSPAEEFRRWSAAITQVEKSRAGKRPLETEWRRDILQYILAHPKPVYGVAELHKAVPVRYAPRDRKDIVKFCRTYGIVAGRVRP